MKIFLTGAEGQLGKACQQVFAADELFLANRENCDITDEEAVHQAAIQFQPEVIIHAAAFTDVSGAETKTADCYEVNVVGTFQVATAAAEVGAYLVALSTDFVFDGTADGPVAETVTPNPLNVYGRSKLIGEWIVRDVVRESLIVRTSGVFGEGKNFVRTMLKLAETKSEISVVANQWTKPTYTVDLAQALQQIITQRPTGILHVAASDETTWADFARAIFAEAKQGVTVQSISTADYPDKTPRPKKALLATDKLAELGIVLPSWQDGLKRYLATL